MSRTRPLRVTQEEDRGRCGSRNSTEPLTPLGYGRFWRTVTFDRGSVTFSRVVFPADFQPHRLQKDEFWEALLLRWMLLVYLGLFESRDVRETHAGLTIMNLLHEAPAMDGTTSLFVEEMQTGKTQE